MKIGKVTQLSLFLSLTALLSIGIGFNAIAQCADENGTCTPSATGSPSYAILSGTASGTTSFAVVGDATGDNSYCIGDGTATGNNSFQIGEGVAEGLHSYCFGNKSRALGDYTYAFGESVETDANATYSYIFGYGTSGTAMENDISNSMMFGVNSTLPTLFIEGGTGTGTWGNVGIGTTSPLGILHVRGEDGDDTGVIIEKNNGQTAGLLFREGGVNKSTIVVSSTDELLIFNQTEAKDITIGVDPTSGTIPQAITIKGNTANVGIGTTSISARLHVTAHEGGSENIAKFSVSDVDNTQEYLQFKNKDSEDDEFAAMILGRGSVTDNEILTIKAAINNGDDTGTKAAMVFESTMNNGSAIATRPLFRWENAGAHKMVMIANGNVGIGTLVPTEVLHINGIGRSNQAQWTTTSDERLKQNVQDISGAREILTSLRPVNFEWVQDYRSTFKGLPQNNWGFIAQEAEQVLPDMVETIPQETYGDSANLVTLSDVKLLNQSPLVPILVKGYQELNDIVVNQSQQIQNLTQLVDSLADVISNCCQSEEPMYRTAPEKESVIENSEETTNSQKILLHQNDPNPFQYTTQIKYEIPDDFETASVLIFDTQGRILRELNITSNNKIGVITVYASDLNKGIYSYSLIVDGKLISTKKMVCLQ